MVLIMTICPYIVAIKDWNRQRDWHSTEENGLVREMVSPGQKVCMLDSPPCVAAKLFMLVVTE